ncbi:MAG: divalent-cation tolerance protein CutA [Planctomycetaceae bacterium]|nr:divalent-cation tolerance protein CutA [Planctomycetaceae bacterium]
MDEPIQVLTTTGDQDTALTIARELVEQRLAACVQVGGPLTSVYRWQGQVETATEWTCAIKTVRRLYAQVESRVRQLHPYEEPEIVVVDLDGGSATYLAWLRAQVAAIPAAEQPENRE